RHEQGFGPLGRSGSQCETRAGYWRPPSPRSSPPTTCSSVARTGRPFSPAAGARAGRGLLAWQVPRRRDRALGDGRASATFEVDTRPPGGGHADRGLVDDVRAFVLRFSAPIITGAAIELLEAGVDEGLVHVTSSDPKSWVRVKSLSEVRLPAGGAPRILLFVHGTLSSTVGGFGSLTTDAGTEFLERAIEAYDAVIGFDHLWTLDQHKARSMIDLPSASGRELVRLKAILDGIKGGDITAFYLHLCEGQRGNERSANEFRRFIDLDVATSATVVIHGSALSAPDIHELADAGCKLVWSPQSNLRLYKETTLAGEAIAADMQVALGADWMPSGSLSLLAEMKVVRRELARQGHPHHGKEARRDGDVGGRVDRGLRRQAGCGGWRISSYSNATTRIPTRTSASPIHRGSSWCASAATSPTDERIGSKGSRETPRARRSKTWLPGASRCASIRAFNRRRTRCR
ncbi:MAG: 5-methylthioadenosine/S-adenosylhomocysteine deaminase, partial [Mycobacterium sp.]|nr:5-methylthioadenosine/S-adenosylhomocysteine deaminase [Mycobacterium sp.]